MSVKPNRQSLLPLLMVAAGSLLVIGSIWMFVSVARPPAMPTPTYPAASIPYPEIRRISLADAKAAFDLGSAIFIDVRGEPYYSQGHIPGALSIDGDELLSHVAELKPTDWIITYCT